MFSIKFCVLIVLNIVEFSWTFNSLDVRRPKFVTTDGNLDIIGAWDRNITFKSSGSGYININGENLLQVTHMAYNASLTINRLKSSYLDRIDAEIKRLSAIVENNNGSSINSNISPTSPLFSPTLMNRRIIALRRRIAKLEVDFATLKSNIEKDECVSNPCRNGGRCQDLFNNFLCWCPDNWEGPQCDVDVNECTKFIGTDLGCQNGGTCINKAGSYECICPPGWYGLHCTRKTNDCDSASSQELCGNGVCVSQKTGYTCICNPGWKTDGVHPACTVDIDECAGDHPHCSVSPLVKCVNVPGKYYCGSCPAGYTGTGYYCTDVDECLQNNGGCSMLPQVQCINTLGSSYCGPCPPGYQGDGRTCTQNNVGICGVNNGGCSKLATCVALPQISPTAVQCSCPFNYVGNGIGENGCVLKANAINMTTGPCATSPCGRNGNCKVKNNDYECTCINFYTGRNCDILDSCTLYNSPCKNGGSCRNTIFGWACDCDTLYYGQRCEYQKEECGGYITKESGRIDYPENRTSYDSNMSCAWTIATTAEKVLNITFTKFDLEKGSGSTCLYDWLQIHDGQNSAAHNLGRYCGSKLPGTNGHIQTTGNKVYLWFRSDSRTNKAGFSLTWSSKTSSCHGFYLSNSHGTLKSPGSPGKYPPNRDCDYIVAAQRDKRIKFNFFIMDLGDNPDCNSDYLEIYDGWTKNDPLLAKYCKTYNTPPEVIMTSGRVAYLHFHSDKEGSYNGFQITYSVEPGIPGCGGLYTKPTGELRNPPFQETSLTMNIECEYLIRVANGSRIKLTYLEMNLKESSTCAYDYIEIREGPNKYPEQKNFITKYCGKNIPPTWTSTSNEVVVRFHSDFISMDDARNFGYRIRYDTVCGGIFNDLNGVIISPNYPNDAWKMKTCEYLISVPISSAIKLSFVQFNIGYNTSGQRVQLPPRIFPPRIFPRIVPTGRIVGPPTNRIESSSPTCSKFGMSVYDGDSNKALKIGDYCGSISDVPYSITSTHNHLFIEYRNQGAPFGSRGSIGPINFRLNYTTINLGCGGILKENIGVVKSPNNLAGYPTNTVCKWLIMAPPGFIVQLTWVNFDLEQSYNCSADYVRVYDETIIPGKSKPLGTYCGKKLPPLIVSTTNVLHIEFKSDTSKTAEGFIANYVMRDESKICGRPYFASYGAFSSPGYPDGYPRNKDCAWTITVPNGLQIMLNITDFEIEQHLDCRFDFLEIRNGGYETSPLIGKFCGKNIPKIITSHSNELWIHFKSDASRSAKGFSLTWDGTTTGCGGSLTAANGHITSPNYPKPYGRSTDCFWKIITSAGSLLQITFFDIDLEPSAYCRLDYVEIHNGLHLTNNPIGKYCNSLNVPAVITSKTNELFVKFRSDASYEGHGFNLKYSTVCNNVIKGHKGVLESPNYPNEYPFRVECVWKISVPSGNKINITFTHFDLEELHSHSTKCANVDYLEIKETGESDQKEIDIVESKKLCGKELPDPITSSYNNVYIRFKSDAAVGGTGFRLEWVIEGCGGELTHPQGSIISPNYPKYYPLNTVCEWVIKVDPDSSVQLTIHELEIERIYSCDFDNLAIYNGPDDTAPQLTKLCATKKNVTLTSSGNLMYVKFTSDASFQGKGFNITYKKVPIRCGGLFTANEGVITSRNYPKNYDNNDDCYWLISLPKTYLIRLAFDDFDIEKQRNCTQDYVNVYDGNSTTAPLLLNHCGNTLPDPVTYISTDNTMLIHMSTDGLFSAKGFKANYTIQCGAHIVTDSSGIIDFTEPGGNTFGENCTWTIESKNPGGHISLTITHLDLRDDYSFDDGEDNSLHIYNGLDNTSALIGSYKNHKIPPTIVSEGSALHLYLPLTYSTTVFVASYSALSTACGGELTSLEGEFGSVGYPKNYPNDMDCVWQFHPAEGNQVSVTFQSFDLDDSENCNEDFVEIREGSPTAKVIQVLCGHKELSAPIKASKLWIRFRSDSEGTQKGFLAFYTLEFGNENITGTEGRIQSPYYPNYYKESQELTWKVTVRMFNVILFRFDDFAFNSWDDSGCTDSYYGFKIYDGDNDQAELLLAECNRNSPPGPVVTTRNVAFIKLVTASDYWRGSLFDLKWNAISRRDVSNYITQPKAANCGSDEVVNLDLVNNITIQSPGYPLGYDNKLLCTWTFTTNSNNHVALQFLDMDLEVQPNCISDSVTVYTSSENTGEEPKTLGKYCLQNATNIKAIEGQNLMKIEFKTNAYYNKTGFKARLFSVCGGQINGRYGTIKVDMDEFVKAHPRYSGYPENFYNCNWNITVRPGRRIKVAFVQFHKNGTRADDECHNFVMLKNGLANDAPLLGIGKYCEADKTSADIPETSGNTLAIRYKGHFPYSNLNFRLRYSEISQSCGDTIVLSKWNNVTNISSPNYPEIPHPYTECEWIIRAPPGEALSINFLERVDITYSTDCSKAGIEVRDGASIRSPLLFLHCRYHRPSTQFSTSNVLYVRFYTNVPEPKNGFKAEIAIATCGGTILPTHNFTITSPNYPIMGSLTKDLQCTWKIIVPLYRGIQITFNDISLPKAQNCSRTAHLNFTETDLETYHLGTVCGSTNKNTTITSYSNHMTVTFTAGGKPVNYFKGFSFNITPTYLKDCGGKLSGPEGVFESPNYGVARRRSQVCKWYITAPEGRRITIQVVDFEKVGSRTGSTDVGLSFFNRDRENYIKLVKSDIFTPNITVEASRNYVFVYYWSFTKDPHRGFQAKWTSNEPTICVGSLNGNSGTIYEPSHHNRLYTRFKVYYCEWQHKSTNPEQETIAITVQKLDMLGTPPSKCSYAGNVLKIFDENGGYTNPLQEFCATLTQPETVRSPYKLTTLAVSQSNQQFNYTVTYKVYKCGGEISNPGVTMDMHGDKQIPSDMSECVWTVQYAEGARIRLTFLSMNLDENCATEYVSIKNGNRHNSPEIGKFCGKKIPDVIISQSNKLWIEFHSNNTSKDRSKPGYGLKMDEIADGCGGVYHSDEMIIKSPNHPKAYPPNTDCTWEVRATEGNTVGLISIDAFQIEETQNCANDFLEVWDYVNDDWKHLGRFCGRDFKTQNSTSNRMKIRFRSNNKTQGTGFQLKWNANCGGVFRVTPMTQRIVSPGYPKKGYENLQVCNYTLIAKHNEDINLEFTDFSLEAGRDQCNFDNVTIFSKRWLASGFKKDWGTYCGEKKPPQLNLKTYVEIIFRTDVWITRRGFAFQFSTSTCGATITQPTTISSPKDRERKTHYAHDSNCYWNITAPPDKLINLRFQKFDLEFSTMCRFDYMNVYDGNVADEKYLLKKLCGSLKYPIVRSTQNHMLIQFHSDSSSSFGGFEAEILFTYGPSQGCGGEIDLLKNHASILTLNTALKDSNGMYLPFLDCHWSIKAPAGYVIKVEFTSVHISICPTVQDAETAALKNKTSTADKKCTCDFIQLNDGPSDAADMIYKHCGHTLPNTVTTSTNHAWLRFVSDGDVASTGFVVNLSLEKSICGDPILYVTDEAKTLTSPNYPNNYPANVRCMWYLVSNDSMNRFDVHFEMLELENADTDGYCSNDRLEITDKVNLNTRAFIAEGSGTKIFNGGYFHRLDSVFYRTRLPTQRYIVCSSSLPLDYYSGVNNVQITFISNAAIEKKGFKMTYRQIGCNRNFTAEQGRIYIQKILQQNCVITITAPKNYTISLYFQTFFIFDIGNCSYSGLSILDGLDKNSKELMRMCGLRNPNSLHSTGNALTLNLWNKRLNKVDTLDIMYTTTDQGPGCGGKLFNYGGKFTSPNYPNVYNKTGTCVWEVSTPQGTLISLQFVNMNLGSKQTCETDYVEVLVRNEQLDMDRRFARYCGGDTPAPRNILDFDTNTVIVKYTTSTKNVGTGWEAMFMSKTRD
ncbi:cubilin-like [Chrysoperla carnea]|uniref:cubilin-like n=1 Tax=Chrysoperla carnea TaxID=189513 RepID=UPI001D0956D4|nr:cubilin-like [Chrysoperla carnea]